MGHDAFEPAEPLRPVIFVEAPLHEQSPGGERPKALDGELMHCGREIERDVRDVRQGTQKAGCEKTGTRPQLEDASHGNRGKGDLGSESVEEFRSPRALHGRGFPCTSVRHEAQIDWARYVFNHFPETGFRFIGAGLRQVVHDNVILFENSNTLTLPISSAASTRTRMPTLGWVFITLYSSSVSLSGNPAEAASNRENWATRQRWPPVQGSRASDRGLEWIDSSRD